jgi:hypothetical protein
MSDKKDTATLSKFQQIVADAAAAKKTLNGKLLENSIKRKFAAAYDSAEAAKDKAEMDYNDTISNLDYFDVQNLVDAKQIINDAADAQDLILEAYKDLFGEDMKVN